jgi:gliding motility-associated-like protein
MMPNAFSPNGDGHNDIFRVAGLTYQQVLYFRVYNRWGQEVYAGFNNEAGWDGTYKGQACDAGTYYYQVALAYPDGQTKVLKGDLLLLR